MDLIEAGEGRGSEEVGGSGLHCMHRIALYAASLRYNRGKGADGFYICMC